MNEEELEKELNKESQFKEIWLEYSGGESLCALINGEFGWLMYLKCSGDAGFSSRNPDIESTKDIEYYLSNGQRDVYPENWAYPVNILKEAMFSFIENGRLPNQVQWHDDSA